MLIYQIFSTDAGFISPQRFFYFSKRPIMKTSPRSWRNFGSWWLFDNHFFLPHFFILLDITLIFRIRFLRGEPYMSLQVCSKLDIYKFASLGNARFVRFQLLQSGLLFLKPAPASFFSFQISLFSFFSFLFFPLHFLQPFPYPRWQCSPLCSICLSSQLYIINLL